ncbi:MAG: YbbR-like domain-containing protein [Bacilli bacterium]
MMSKKSKDPINKSKKIIKFNFFTRFFRSIGGMIDLLFSKNIMLVIISIISASLLYIYVIDLPSQLELKNLETRTLENVKIEIVNNDKAKVIEVFDQTNKQLSSDIIYADLIVKGPRNEVIKMINNKENKFFIDTSAVKDGESKDMQVSVENVGDNIVISSSPSSFKIVAHKKVVRDDLKIDVEAVNVDKMGNNLTVESISLSGGAQISGSREKVESVASLKALVNVESISSPGTVELGKDAITYRAYNVTGETVNVDVSVKEKKATVVATDYGKSVPIVVNFMGDLPDGQSVSSYELSTEEVYIYGDKDSLNSINELKIDVDLGDVKSTNSITLTIPKPDDVISLSETKVTVKLTYDKTSKKTIKNVPVQSINAPNGYSVQSPDGELLLSVELSGADSVLREIDAEDIMLEVDLIDLTSGKHSVKVKVSGLDSRVKYSLSKEKVIVELSKS